MNAFIQPCGLSSGSVRRHYMDTVIQTVSLDRVAPHVSVVDLDALSSNLRGGELRLWGVMPGRQNDVRFSKLAVGDIGYFYGDKLLHGSFSVMHIFPGRQPALARELWGEVKGESWEHMYALGPVTPRAVALRSVQKAFGHSSNWKPQGFTVYRGSRADQLMALRSSNWTLRTELFARHGLDREGRSAATTKAQGGRRHLLQEVARDHVLAAIAEYDAMGQDAFLEKYGFEASRRYWLVHEGRQYASKAILGAAAGFVTDGVPLHSSEFSGGIDQTLRILHRLGFDTNMQLDALVVGTRIENRRVISALYGGNPQSGITPFRDGHLSLFSHRTSPYEDESPSSEHEFTYRGQGARGTQSLDSAGNRALETARTSRSACRFWHQEEDGAFRFLTWVAVVGRSWTAIALPDGSTQHQISWILQPVPGPDVSTWPARAVEATEPVGRPTAGDDSVPPESADSYGSLCEELDGQQRGSRRRSRPRVENPYVRSEKARRAVRLRASGCENPRCAGMPPDVGSDGRPLLDVDHVKPLARGGADHPSNMIAVCPNCHRAKTFGRRAREWESLFAEISRTLHRSSLGEISQA